MSDRLQSTQRKLTAFSGYDTPAELLLRGMLERNDLRRGVLADVEVALAEVEAMRERLAEHDQLRESLRWAMKWVPEPQTPHNIYASNYSDARKALDG